MTHEPRLMDFSRMKDIMQPHLSELGKHLFMNRELAVLYGDTRVFRHIAAQQPPFTINDHRLGIVVRGEGRVELNLVEKHLEAGMLVFIGPGSVITPLSLSDDLQIFGFGLSTEFPMPFAADQLPSAFNGQVRDFQVRASQADIATARGIVDLLWQVIHKDYYNRQLVGALVAAQMHHYDSLYRAQAEQMAAERSREQTIFDRFIYLVNRHCGEQHQLAFYAERMCLTERYLGVVVRHATGVTAKEWIDRAIVTKAKVLLRHSDRSVQQVAEELHFPNPSFFSKYFSRLTGTTPRAYKLS